MLLNCDGSTSSSRRLVSFKSPATTSRLPSVRRLAGAVPLSRLPRRTLPNQKSITRGSVNCENVTQRWNLDGLAISFPDEQGQLERVSAWMNLPNVFTVTNASLALRVVRGLRIGGDSEAEMLRVALGVPLLRSTAAIHRVVVRLRPVLLIEYLTILHLEWCLDECEHEKDPPSTFVGFRCDKLAGTRTVE